MSNFFRISESITQVNNNADQLLVRQLSASPINNPSPFFVTKLDIAYVGAYGVDDLSVQIGFSTSVDGSNPIYFTGASQADFNSNKITISKVFEQYSLFVPASFQTIVFRTNTKADNVIIFRMSGLNIPSTSNIATNMIVFASNVTISGSDTYQLATLPPSLYKSVSIYWSIPSLAGTGTINLYGQGSDIATSMSSPNILNEVFSNNIITTSALTATTDSISPSTTLSYWITYAVVT